MTALKKRGAIISFSFCLDKLSTEKPGPAIHKGSLALEVGWAWFIMFRLPVFLSRRGEAHPVKRQFKVKALLKISKRVWTEFKWCTELSGPQRHNLAQCSLPPSTAAQHFSRHFWKANPGQRVCTARECCWQDWCAPTNHAQWGQRYASPKYHTQKATLEMLFFFMQLLESCHYGKIKHEFSLRKRQIKLPNFPVMDKSRKKSKRKAWTHSHTPVQNSLFH